MQAAIPAMQNIQIGFQKSATPVMDHIMKFHNILNIVACLIVLFVMAIMIYVTIRFRQKKNPQPSNNTHNWKLELIWTIIPIIIVAGLSFPSYHLIKFEENVPPKTNLTFKVTGHQWYWSYDFPDRDIQFESHIIPDDELKEGDIRLLSVDNPLYLPTNTNIRILVTSDDVIHSWSVPSFGVKTDAVPGRLNETWINIKSEGDYYGQCYELCGMLHGFMPIMVKAVSLDKFDLWIDSMKAPENSPEKQISNIS